MGWYLRVQGRSGERVSLLVRTPDGEQRDNVVIYSIPYRHQESIQHVLDYCP
jgi:hypothetical protein